MKENIPSGLKSKQEIYYEATHKQIGNPDGTRMDVIFEAMQMYADQFQPPSSTSVQVEELAKERAVNLIYKIVEQWGNAVGPTMDDFVNEMLSIAASPKGKEEEGDSYKSFERPKILFTKSALPLVLEALNIKTDIPLDKIGGFYNGKVYESDLLGIIKLSEDIIEGRNEKTLPTPQPKDTSGMQWGSVKNACKEMACKFMAWYVDDPEEQVTSALNELPTDNLIEDVYELWVTRYFLPKSAPILSTQQGERMFTLKEALEIYYDAQLFEYADNSKLYFKHKFGINL